MSPRIFVLMGWMALAATLVAPLAYLVGGVELSVAQRMMLIGTIAWFAVSGSAMVRGASPG